MDANELYAKGNEIYRVLYIDGARVLVINCIRRTMPIWVDNHYFDTCVVVTEDDLIHATFGFKKYNELAINEQNAVQKKYNSISAIVPFIHKDAERSRLIELSANEYQLNKVTIRNRLCEYLAFQDLGVFNHDKSKRNLSSDEKIFRWALNKFYYSSIKLTLQESYRKMIKEKYCDSDGKIKADIPTYRQFSYFYHKHLKMERQYISRNGKGDYMRNHRALLGNGVRDFCPSIGYGMLDSTVCDIFLVNSKGELLGRPILTACVDGYSSMCLGYSLGFCGGIKSLNRLVENICHNKVEHCRKFGIQIENEDWNCSALPRKMITDKGREYVGDCFSQLTDLGIVMLNLPPYRPELKGPIEKFFDLIQASFKSELATRGVIFEDYQDRGGVDYRKKACLTLDDFEKIVLLCIINYNTKRVIDLPNDMVGKCQPFANCLWNLCLESNANQMISINQEMIHLTLLPRVKGEFKRNGLVVNKIRYRNPQFKECYLQGGECVVAVDPDNVGTVWLLENGQYFAFEVIDTYFQGMESSQASAVISKKSEGKKNARRISLQGRIDLSKEIGQIAKSISASKVTVTDVKKHRKDEGK